GGAAIGLLLPARLDRIVRFGGFQFEDEATLALGGKIGPVTIVDRAGHRIQQVETGAKSGTLDLEEGFDRAHPKQVLARAHADLAQPGSRFWSDVANLDVAGAHAAASSCADGSCRLSRYPRTSDCMPALSSASKRPGSGLSTSHTPSRVSPITRGTTIS